MKKAIPFKEYRVVVIHEVNECPFCGHNAPVIIKDPNFLTIFFGECGRCGARGPKWNTKSGAHAAWKCRSEKSFYNFAHNKTKTRKES
jgi:hypothetical protein